MNSINITKWLFIFIFVLFVVPINLLAKVFRIKFLEIGYDSHKKSYWHNRPDTSDFKERWKSQY